MKRTTDGRPFFIAIFEVNVLRNSIHDQEKSGVRFALHR